MNHPIYRVVSISVVAPFTLQILFDDGKERVIDFSPVLEGELYGPLRDEEMFKQGIEKNVEKVTRVIILKKQTNSSQKKKIIEFAETHKIPHELI